jgi:hypothetical protein
LRFNQIKQEIFSWLEFIFHSFINLLFKMNSKFLKVSF